MANSSPDNASPQIEGRAIDLLRSGVFPEWWTFIPVAGKATFVKEWSTKPLTKEQCILEYKTKQAYRGLGVVTGEFSGGLIALDIDGLSADDRYEASVGEAYEAPGEESTMSWTSGRPGRRQILYRVPASVVPELRHVKTLILRADGEWHLGNGDTDRNAQQEAQKDGDAEYEEVVLRFNQCQSVVPGSPHPSTGMRYRFLNYNEGKVALAPEWLLDILRGFRKPVQWLSDADQKALDAELGETAIPSRQIRGWFFKEEVQALLRPRLEELVFRHETFDAYGWRERDGAKPQRMSGCPWHGGKSGTSFQYSPDSGCWDCKACGVGGDVLDFIHKVRVNNLHAERPQGPDLEVYVAEIATALGFNYPEDARASTVKNQEVPLRRLTGHEFFSAALKIEDSFENAELGDYHLMELVRDAGLMNVYRSGPQVRAALERFMLHEQQELDEADWQEKCRGQRDYLIPDFVSRPSSIMLHARGGLGKTRLAVLISKIVGQQQTMRVRGLEVQPTLSGNVLFIGNDMSMTDYAEYFDQQGIDTSGPDRWMKFKPQWQQSQYKVLLRWLNEHKPVLVVIDSLTSVSTMIAAKEYEKEYATTLYRLARENGTAFPATTFLWIHHDKKDGTGFRGTDTLRNAVHETWHLKELSDEERAEFGDHALILEIDKSRGMRGGDRFLVREDIEEALSLEDLTPTVKRDNRGQGDETPRTLVLGILKEASGPLTVKELRYELNSRLSGRRGQGAHVSARTVQRWLKAWVGAGLVVSPGSQTSVGKGRPEPLFEVASSIYEANSVVKSVENLEIPVPEGDLINDTGLSLNAPEEGCVVKSAQISPETGGTRTVSLPTENGVTQVASPTPSGEGPAINDTSDTTEGVSLNTMPENRSRTGVSSDQARISDIPAQVKEKPVLRYELDNWGEVDWG
ncbi:bifunctional DNA primase/polymerase [Synechococcus sp. CBW1004]|uniref:bifunctional DNA primase/polymerase n=1 Tax=Synechococcus sp. CBW1004 TaxID=1353136 RepID=UPI0018CF4C04|nr:bifunctional DNA primase/polymerase [Synechococcus sp. CBW1004]QPN63687.1 bifunctional DNA primase/polymerase [Synechococcus sp. CBW1004]